jgi:hypothetical protein
MHHPHVIFSHNKPDTSNESAVLFFKNKSATSNQSVVLFCQNKPVTSHLLGDEEEGDECEGGK